MGKFISGIAAIILALSVLFFGLAGLTTVEPGEYAILVKQFGEGKGVQKDGLDVGTHWNNVFTYDVETYDTKADQHPLEVDASTKDGQPVRVNASLEISLQHDKVKDLHSLIGRDYYARVVEPAAKAAIRDALPTQLSDKVYTDAGRAFIQGSIIKALEEKQVAARGILVSVNLQEIKFLNDAFVQVLEKKASAAQQEEIERRQALAAEQAAIGVANAAEGEKQKRIKAAEAQREELRLAGEGNRLRDEETAKGQLALRSAEAEGQRLLVNAYGSKPEIVADIEWARNVGKNIQIWGVPTGAPGTNALVDYNGLVEKLGAKK